MWGKGQKSKSFRSGDHTLFPKFLYKVKTQQSFREKLESTADCDVIKLSFSWVHSLPRGHRLVSKN